MGRGESYKSREDRGWKGEKVCNFYDWLDIPSISSFSSVDDTTAIGVDTYCKGLQRKKAK